MTSGAATPSGLVQFGSRAQPGQRNREQRAHRPQQPAFRYDVRTYGPEVGFTFHF
jgi:hypothetical protein